MSAVRALIVVSTQRGGAAACDGEQHLFVLSVDPLATALNKGLPCITNDVGHLQRWPVHAFCIGFPSPRIVSASSGLPVALRCRRERWVCQVFCVNDLDFVLGFGFVVALAVVVGFGDGVQGKGAFPLPLHIHVERA